VEAVCVKEAVFEGVVEPVFVCVIVLEDVVELVIVFVAEAV